MLVEAADGDDIEHFKKSEIPEAFENGIFQLNYEQIIFLCKLYEITPNDIFEI